MKSPTSLIRFRNAVGVMLAMSALFAVVLSAITITQDRALGQATPSASRSFDSTSVDPGGQVEVMIAASNYGQFGQVVETLPAGFSYVSSSLRASQVRESGSNQVRFILQGDTSFTYMVTASSTPGSYEFIGTLRDEERAPYSVGGSAQVTVTAPDTAAAARSFNPTSVDSGGQVEVMITASNYGQFGQVVETLPAGFSYVSSSLRASQVQEPGSNQVRFTLQGDTSFTYTVTASSTPGSYTFSGTLQDENRNDYTVGGSAHVTVRTPAEPTLTPSPTPPPGATATPTATATPALVSPAKISKIEPRAKSVTLSAGDKVMLGVTIYGLQSVADDKLASDVTFEWKQGTTSLDGSEHEIEYTAPSSPGTYTITASLDSNECDGHCTATVMVSVRRPAAAPAPADPPQNPPGDIPTILTDGDGNNYEVFTPEDGGSFTGEGYSLTAGAGAVPNGEFIGIRVSDEGSASNVGMTHQRYTLGGNMYMVSAVDASGASISSYELSSAAMVCLPLPDELRTNISDVAIVAMNADGSLTILSSTTRIGSAGADVCGHLSGIPASVAVGSQGAPEAIPTATPEPTPTTPETGGTAPSSNMGLWVLLFGVAIVTFGTLLTVARRRESARK